MSLFSIFYHVFMSKFRIQKRMNMYNDPNFYLLWMTLHGEMIILNRNRSSETKDPVDNTTYLWVSGSHRSGHKASWWARLFECTHIMTAILSQCAKRMLCNIIKRVIVTKEYVQIDIKPVSGSTSGSEKLGTPYLVSQYLRNCIPHTLETR